MQLFEIIYGENKKVRIKIRPVNNVKKIFVANTVKGILSKKRRLKYYKNMKKRMKVVIHCKNEKLEKIKSRIKEI